MSQVLLSQVHRLRALVLLGRFLDMGSWAVDLALSVGIFPYVLKLLQTTASDLRTTLILIWTKILALDKSCQVHLHAYRPVTSPCTCLSQATALPKASRIIPSISVSAEVLCKGTSSVHDNYLGTDIVMFLEH